MNIFTNDQRPRDNTLVHYQLFAARICLTSIHENTEPCMGNNYRLVWTARNYRTVTTIRLYDIVFTRCVDSKRCILVLFQSRMLNISDNIISVRHECKNKVNWFPTIISLEITDVISKKKGIKHHFTGWSGVYFFMLIMTRPWLFSFFN